MKRNLLKVIGISFLIFVVLSWIIPVGTYSNGELTTNGTDPVGLFDLFSVPISTLLTFALYAVVFAAIGGLYGVMEKSGALEIWVEKITKKFNGKEKGFLIFTVIFFVILSSITGLVLPLFALVPLFAAVIFALNYDKITALASTVGAILIGSVCSTYGFNVTGYTKNILSLDMNNEIWAKLLLLVLLTIALAYFVVKFGKRVIPAKTEKAEKSEPKKVVKAEKTTTKKKAKTEPTKTAKSTAKKQTTKKTTKKTTTKKNTQNMAVAKDVKKVDVKKTISIVPLVIIITLMILVSFIGMYNWYYSFNIEWFNDIHTSVMGVKIGDYAIFEHLFSSISQLGYWGNVEFVTVMIIAAALIAWVYRVGFNGFIDSFIAGVKKMLPTAICAALASVILTVLYQASYSGMGTIVDTMYAKAFELSDGFNVVITGLVSLVGSFFYNDLYYLLAGMSPFLTSFDADSLQIAGLLIQSVASLGMIIFPTSVILIAGLSYFNVSYKSWIKYIWKFALAVFLVILLVCCILTVM